MREKDEVVVYLVVVGTVESVDRRVIHWLRRIHHSYHTGNRLYVSRNIPISIISTYPQRIEFMKLARACEAVRRSFVPTSLPLHRIPLHLGLWLRILNMAQI